MAPRKKASRSTYIEVTDALIKDFYSVEISGDQPKNVQLFNIYLHSDNATEDLKILFANIRTKYWYDTTVIKNLPYDQLIVNRHHRIMHRIRAQLYELHTEGADKAELAKMISIFMLKEYEKYRGLEKILYLWTNFMGAYNTIQNGGRITEETMRFCEIVVKKLTSIISHNTIYAVDAYTIARMFRTFPHNPQHIDSKKIVIYAGDFHIANYVKFFTQVLGTEFKSYEPNKKLIDELLLLDDPKHPIFEDYRQRIYEEASRCIDVDIDDFLD